MIQNVEQRVIYTDNNLYLDYIAGREDALSFFAHRPRDFGLALAARKEVNYPRAEVCSLLETYNMRLQASDAALENLAALRADSTFCVIAGQQAGFLGGPCFTTYKIITTIRLAKHLERELGTRVVPLFWLASDDHDFTEINRVFFLKRDGEVSAVRFTWAEQGRPIHDLPLSKEVVDAYSEYFGAVIPGPNLRNAKELFAPEDGENYCTWHARIWSRLFSDYGLILVDPALLRSPACPFFLDALKRHRDIQVALGDVAEKLRSVGYQLALPGRAGGLYTLADDGRRVRVDVPSKHLSSVVDHPERYSPDAALRPLLADALFPVLASVLGPGEIAYHAMLRPLYEIFELPQPLLFPRKSYTVLSPEEHQLLLRWETSVQAILDVTFDPDRTTRKLLSPRIREPFSKARADLSEAMAPLSVLLKGIDPGLDRAWANTHVAALRGIDRLEKKTARAELAKRGLFPQQLRQLRNILRPRERPQERIFPLPHFINQYGNDFLKRLFSMGKLDDFSHHIICMEEDHG